MHVGRETSAQCECVGAGLFLSNTPLLCLARLSVQIRANQFRPLDARFHFDQTVSLIKRNHAIEGPRVDANAIRAKLLATHGMTAARNGDGKAFSRRGAHNLSKFLSGTRLQQFANASAIELRMDVVNPNLFLAFCEDVRRKRKKRRRAYEFTAGQHRGSLTAPVRLQPDKLPRLLR